MWILRSDADAEGAPLTLRLTPGVSRVIGRAPLADFLIDGALVSRRHCRLSVSAAGQLEVEDLNSTNGTFVNGTRVSRSPLVAGDRLRVGRIVFTVGFTS